MRHRNKNVPKETQYESSVCFLKDNPLSTVSEFLVDINRGGCIFPTVRVLSDCLKRLSDMGVLHGRKINGKWYYALDPFYCEYQYPAVWREEEVEE